MEHAELKNIIEALLLAHNEPLSLDKIIAVFDEWQKPSLAQIRDIIHTLQTEYATRAMELIEVASGYQLQTKAQYSNWVSRLQIEKPAKYSRALLETLAVIAYKQPVTRGDIEEIRGVGVASTIIRTLIEREWIRVAGHKDVPGKPAVYVTTKGFLNYFNLQYLHELPTIPELKELADSSNIECVTK